MQSMTPLEFQENSYILDFPEMFYEKEAVYILLEF